MSESRLVGSFTIDLDPRVVGSFEVQIEGATAPSAPSNLAAAAASSSQIDLTWTDNADNETGFEVQHDTDSGFGSATSITGIAADSTSYSVTGLDASTLYYFRVRATNEIGNSDWSDTASATTDVAYLVRDTLTDTNGTLITAHAPDIDNGDTTYSASGAADGSIQNNRHQNTTAAFRNIVAVIDAGQVPSQVNIDFRLSGANDGVRVYISRSSGTLLADGIHVLASNASDTLEIVDGSTTLASTSYTFSTGVTYTLTLAFDSGSNQLTATVTDGTTPGSVPHTYVGSISNTSVGWAQQGVSGLWVDTFEAIE